MKEYVAFDCHEHCTLMELVHPRKAKLMMGCINKTGKLDVHGLNVLERNGTLPTVWIPPAKLRDLRELTRTRIVLARHLAEATFHVLRRNQGVPGPPHEGQRWSNQEGVGAEVSWPLEAEA